MTRFARHWNLTTLLSLLRARLRGSYRPERHYMRGKRKL
jgi:hypothetical protein